MDYTTSPHGQKAKALFLEGYNCSQAIAMAFREELEQKGFPMQATLAMVGSMGGGMGRLREVCGTVSAIFLVAGALYGYSDPKDKQAKAEHYARIQQLAARFQEVNGKDTIVCRELLGLGHKKDAPTPSERTPEYYKKRPCPDLCAISAAVLEEYIQQHPWQ